MNEPIEEDVAAVTEHVERERPVCGRYEPEHHAFWLTRRKGKNLTNGGFGIVLPRVTPLAESIVEDANGVTEKNPKEEPDKEPVTTTKPATTTTTTTTTTSQEYLHLEEAIFLYERGVLEVQNEHGQQMEPQQLYALLNQTEAAGGMSLAVYLAYAHLRQQGFRVVRHSPERRRILRAMDQLVQHEQQEGTSTDVDPKKDIPEEEKDVAIQDEAKDLEHDTATDSNNNNNNNNNGDDTTKKKKWKQWAELRLALREASAQAIPRLATSALSCPLAWDAYPPDQTFTRSAPGLPVFSVLVTLYNNHNGNIPFAQINHCIQDNDPVPIKIATVSDSGIVVLFGVVNEGIPIRTVPAPK